MKKLFSQVISTFLGGALALCCPLAAFGQWGSFDNGYIGSPDCKPLIGVTATVKFTQTVLTNGVGGDLGFQLSAWSLNHFSELLRIWQSPYVDWQQYMTGISVSPAFVNPTMQAFGPHGATYHMVEAWPWGGAQGQLLPLAPLSQSSPDGLESLTIPAGYAIAAGTEFTIALQNDNRGNVTGATFKVANAPNSASGFPGSSQTTALWKDGPGFKKYYLAPIVGFEFNFNGGTGNIASVLPWVSQAVGTQVTVGTITYTASSRLAVWTAPGVLPTVPICSAANLFTGETTNAFYTPIEPVQGASDTFTQSFGIVVQPSNFPASCGPAGSYLPYVKPNGQLVWKCSRCQVELDSYNALPDKVGAPVALLEQFLRALSACVGSQYEEAVGEIKRILAGTQTTRTH
jgi:hypothetical protein